MKIKNLRRNLGKKECDLKGNSNKVENEKKKTLPLKNANETVQITVKEKSKECSSFQDERRRE